MRQKRPASGKAGEGDAQTSARPPSCLVMLRGPHLSQSLAARGHEATGSTVDPRGQECASWPVPRALRFPGSHSLLPRQGCRGTRRSTVGWVGGWKGGGCLRRLRASSSRRSKFCFAALRTSFNSRPFWAHAQSFTRLFASHRRRHRPRRHIKHRLFEVVFASRRCMHDPRLLAVPSMQTACAAEDPLATWLTCCVPCCRLQVFGRSGCVTEFEGVLVSGESEVDTVFSVLAF